MMEAVAEGGQLLLGRRPELAEAAVATGDLDPLVSRRHARLQREGDRLLVERLPGARHEFVSAETRESLPDRMVLEPGGTFSIHAMGRLIFHWVRDPAEVKELRRLRKPREDAFSGEISLHGMQEHLQALQYDLPLVLQGWREPVDLLARLARFLSRHLQGQGRMRAGFLSLRPDGHYQLLAEDDGLDNGASRISRSLLRRWREDGGAVHGEILIYPPSAPSASGGEAAAAGLSIDHAYDWIGLVPVGLEGETAFQPCRAGGSEMVLYLESSGGLVPAAVLPFARLLTGLAASLLSTWESQRVRQHLGSFFSPRLRDLMSEGRMDLLEPADRLCTVLMLDREGSSRRVEEAATAADRLILLQENVKLLEVASRAVEETGGTVADFTGDGLLAFWGWPDGPDTVNHVRQGMEAVHRILAATVCQEGFPAIRMGLHTGPVAVGQIGPPSHFKIGVFGETVNLAARLEGLGKSFGPVVLSEAVAYFCQGPECLPLRRLARVIPAGFSQGCALYAPLPPALTAASAACYTAALEAFERQEWAACGQLLRHPGLAGDLPAGWLGQQAVRYEAQPPGAGWDGSVRMDQK